MDKSISMNGLPVVLTGNTLCVGDKAPNFKLVGNSLNIIQKQDFEGKVLVISCVPSVDTPVCDIETRRFNVMAGKLSDRVRVLTVSKDLPFAQARWCAAAGVNNVLTASDYRDFGFAKEYGVLLEDLGLLTRAIFIVDGQGIIRYIQFVPEVSHEPNYDEILIEIQKVL